MRPSPCPETPGYDRDRSAVRRAADRRYRLDSSKISAELGFRPYIPFAQGLADTVDSYKRNRAWWAPLKKAADGTL
ncbi:dTDP-glucose 4,6-dehydratase [Sinosporangium album]|uniref:dTDP-glucose 4,6-dehydratase n=1 Tax=Sinosporangium album TaxID=504805 RepID=A0A1G8DXW7_9ACTN|nr:hypothetical protein [Sinosporangium album]SDH62320.1 dTDP-glucose 4,6-dehydratase [Sinosporangium album]